MFDYFPHFCKYFLPYLVYLISFHFVLIFNWQLAMFNLFYFILLYFICFLLYCDL